MAYLTFEQWRDRTIMSSDEAGLLNTSFPAFIPAKLAEHTAWLDGRLRKRYAAPFAAPVPEIVLSWLERLVTLDVYMKRGFNPQSEQDGMIAERAKEAKAEVLEAANSETGLFDLPLRQDTTATGISRGGPFAQSDATPYGFLDAQREEVRGNGRW